MLRKVSQPRSSEQRFDLKGSRGFAAGAWLTRHLQSLFSSLGAMARAPLSSLMTSAVIGIALALPAGLYLLLDNVTSVTGHWDTGGRISVFLDTAVSDADAEELATRLGEWEEVAGVSVITRSEALAEYRSMSGFAEVIEAFEDSNPLPAVLTVEPIVQIQNPQAMENLATRISRLPEVDVARFDLQWLRRLNALVEIVIRGVYLLGALLALGVVLIIGNTIRLGIENRREEIEIASLFGATKAFIRRPFLYGGLLYGLLGAVIAWCILTLGFVLLEPAVGRLISLYGSSYQLTDLSGRGVLALAMAGGGLGLAGAWVAVGRHLSRTVPE